eukprot:c23343_g1_i2 orf=90-725(+)
MAASSSLSLLAGDILAEIHSVFEKAEALDTHPVQTIVQEVLRCRNGTIVLHGVGREGLMMKAFAMRLFHLGLNSHCVGDMTTPPVSSGDLLIVSAGPGGFSTVNALCAVAREAGAYVLLVTAQSQGSASHLANAIVVLPAQTMADDVISSKFVCSGDSRECVSLPSRTSVLPMGSLFEGSLFVLFEMVVLELREALGESTDSMRTRHTNLE